MEKPSPYNPWLVAVLAAVAIFGSAYFLMWKVGLFDIPASDPGAKTLAAVLALVAAVLATAVTLIGIVLKNSIDNRNHALAVEAEKRNRIEAAIRAVSLLGENNQDTTRNQMGGSLLALVSLGEISLATALLGQLWPEDKVMPHVADVVLTEAFKADSEHTKDAASVILMRNAAKIRQKNFNIWPFPGYPWDLELSTNCRFGLVEAAIEWMKEEIRFEAFPHGLFPQAVIVLNRALDDTDISIRSSAAAALRPFVSRIPQDVYLYLRETQEKLTVQSITEHLENMEETMATIESINHEAEVTKLLKKFIEQIQSPPDPIDGH